MSRFISPRLGRLEEYVPGEQPQDMQYIKLNTNELPYPPSPEIIAAVNGDEAAKLRLYSDPESAVLRKKLAERYDVHPENVFVGNGSDEVLNFAFMAYGGEGVIFPDISYGFYEVFAELYGVNFVKAPLRDDFTIDINDYISCGKTVVIANPNAPTGLSLSKSQIIKIIESNPDRVVIIDEAYVDFGGESVIPLTKEYENLLVVSTFSKSRALAGARVGFGIACPELIRDLNRIKNTTNPYNINRISSAAAAAALDSRNYFDEKVAEIISVRERIKAELAALGFYVTDSKANFIFASSDIVSGGELYSELKKRGILVRHFSSPRINNFVRITVGTPEQMNALMLNIKEIIKGRE